jgi:phosphatidylglycerophosphate synthase
MTRSKLPPFSALLKSREVEDPVNLLVHRPLAYAFVWAVHRTPVTPNMVTFLAMAVGMVAGSMWLWGTPAAMVAGGVLLWSSAILDGADGILARAKQMQSDFGRALDGAADTVVAVSTVLPAFYIIWERFDRDPLVFVFCILAILTTLPHLYMYDFYKESYLRNTRLDRGGEGSEVDVVEQRYEEQRKKLGLASHFAVTQILLPMLRSQRKLVALTNPLALRDGKSFARSEETARIYREHNAGPMRLWAAISLAPHSYLLAICGMFDRLDVYLWIRLFGMNAIWISVMIWQRRATYRTMQDLREIGAEPLPVAQRA